MTTLDHPIRRISATAVVNVSGESGNVRLAGVDPNTSA